MASRNRDAKRRRMFEAQVRLGALDYIQYWIGTSRSNPSLPLGLGSKAHVFTNIYPPAAEPTNRKPMLKPLCGESVVRPDSCKEGWLQNAKLCKVCWQAVQRVDALKKLFRYEDEEKGLN